MQEEEEKARRKNKLRNHRLKELLAFYDGGRKIYGFHQNVLHKVIIYAYYIFFPFYRIKEKYEDVKQYFR